MSPCICSGVRQKQPRLFRLQKLHPQEVEHRPSRWPAVGFQEKGVCSVPGPCPCSKLSRRLPSHGWSVRRLAQPGPLAMGR